LLTIDPSEQELPLKAETLRLKRGSKWDSKGIYPLEVENPTGFQVGYADR
jgi:hypothetical protein